MMSSVRAGSSTMTTSFPSGNKRMMQSKQNVNTGPTWEELRKEARTLENEIDYKLITFSKVAASLKNNDGFSFSGDKEPLMSASSKSENFENMSADLDNLLRRLSDVNQQMAGCVNTSGGGFNHTLQRHREILQDYNADFNKTKNNIVSMRQRQELLGSVERDLQSYRNGGGSLNRRSEMLNKEQEHARNADRVTDEIINMASATRDTLFQQRGTFKKVQSQLNEMARKYPAINNLLIKINIRKRRDSIIIGAVISLCIIFLIWYAIR